MSVWNSGPANQSAGVAILISKHLQHKIQNTNSDNLGRRIAIDIKIQNGTYQLLKIYGSKRPKTKENVFQETKHYRKNLKNVMSECDFNMGEELRDREVGNINNFHLTALNTIKKLKNVHNLEDTWRLKHPTKNVYTYHDKNLARKIDQSRIDQIYKTKNIIMKTTQILPFQYSDHDAVLLTTINNWKQQKINYNNLTQWRVNTRKNSIKYSTILNQNIKNAQEETTNKILKEKQKEKPDLNRISKLHNQLEDIKS